MNQDGNSSASQEQVFSSADNSSPDNSSAAPAASLAGAITSAPDSATNAPAKRARFGFGGRRFNASTSAAAPTAPANPNMPDYFNAAMGDVVVADPAAPKQGKGKKIAIIAGIVLLVAGITTAVVLLWPNASKNYVSASSVGEKINSDVINKIRDMEKRLKDYYYGRSSLLSVSNDVTKKALSEGIDSLKAVNETLKNNDHVNFNNTVVDLSSLKKDASKSLTFFQASINRYNSYYSYITEGEKDDTFESFSSAVKNSAVYHKKYNDYKAGKLAEGEQLDANMQKLINDALSSNVIGKEIFFNGDEKIDDYIISEKISNQIMSFWEEGE